MCSIVVVNRCIEHDTLHVHIRYCIIIIMIAPNEFLAVQQYPERSMPSLKQGNLRPPKQYCLKSLNKVVYFTYLCEH